MKKKSKGKIAYTLYAIILIPLIIFGMSVLFLGFFMIRNAMYRQIRNELQNVAGTLNLFLERDFPGDLSAVSDDDHPGALRIYKGDEDITLRFDIVDSVHDATGLDITLFYQDTRVLTTLKDRHDVRHTGTGASTPILKDVFQTGAPRYYQNALIEGNDYCCYYLPLRNADGSVAGMLAVGKPTMEVTADVWRTFRPMIAIDLLLMLVVILLISRFTGRLGKDVQKVNDFLREAAGDNPDAVLDPAVEKRNDELGEIGSAIVTMHRSLRDSMEMDPLTRIANRRSADRKMKKLMVSSRSKGIPLSLCIGDIDFFKKVNDTYGHDMGDLVLRSVADCLTEHVKDSGFVARWGGEEFLLVFYNSDLEEARAALEQLRQDISNLLIRSDDLTIDVTMSFGVTLWDGTQSFDDLVKKADELLYYAKEHGRNRVVHLLPGEEAPQPPAPGESGPGEILELDPAEADAILSGEAAGAVEGIDDPGVPGDTEEPADTAPTYDLEDTIDVDDSDKPDPAPDPDDPYSDEEAEEDEYP
ncbi:MAG: diguanylate cyclase [Lachnospiraceae bacterium]|nr:diguanylate cyclase [Lachnospiraceae bacterium]